MVATCNVGEYNIPEEVYDSPTVRLYPVFEKKCPMHIFGDTSNPEEYENFINELGTNPKYFHPSP
jgi:hypothetical protein